MKTGSVISKKHIMLGLLFAIYMSEYMLSLICMDQAAYSLSGSGEMLHYLKMPALAAGILLFPASRRLGATIRLRHTIMLICNLVFVAGMIFVMGLAGAVGTSMLVISCVITLLSLGCLGGAVYYYFAMGFVDHPYMGRLGGIAGAAAFLIQMLVSSFTTSNLTVLILLLIGFVFTAYMTIGTHERFDWMFDEPLEYAKKGDPSLPDSRAIAAGIIGMFLLYTICGLTDTVIVSMNFAGDMSMYAWPRLFGAVGYLVAGFLSDIGRKRWIMLSALCFSILSIPLPFMLQEGHTLLATCLYYVVAIAQLMFLNVFFWNLAPRTSHQQLVAGLSRILGCISAIILPVFSNAPVMADMVAVVILAAATVICIAIGGYFPPAPASRKSSPSGSSDPGASSGAGISEKERLEEFAAQHSLTPREKDVLIPLIESDDDVSIIASNMNTSTRTVYRHINSIYEKTGTETRYALMRYYYRS